MAHKSDATVTSDFKKTLKLEGLAYSKAATNLLSQYLLLEQGLRVEYDVDKVIITDKATGVKLASGPQIGGLWWIKLQKKESQEQSFVNYIMRNEDLWHHRLGHQSWKYSKLLLDNNWVELPSGLNFKEKDFCAGCAKGKLTEAVIPKLSSGTESFKLSKPIQKLYLDSVTVNKLSVRGFKGFTTVTDAVSRYRWIILNKKGDRSCARARGLVQATAGRVRHEVSGDSRRQRH